jgi:hypothetical protein
MIGTEVMHRLFLPVFAGQLPRRLRRRLENLVELASLFERQTDFPTSLPDIGARFRLGPLPDPERVFRNSCEYLAERFGLGLAAGDVEVAL